MERRQDEVMRTLLARAAQELGTKEKPGKASNLKIDGYLATTRGAASGDETPWCSAFVNAIVEACGLQGTKSRAARSWLSWGLECDPVPGCVVVLWRGASNSWQGHVGFLDHVDEQGNPVLLGGNQGNAVSRRVYPRARVLGYRMPR